jgi:hypothetical protein
MVFNATFNNIPVISAVSFIGGGNWSTWRKPQTCCNSLTNFTFSTVTVTGFFLGHIFVSRTYLSLVQAGSCTNSNLFCHIFVSRTYLSVVQAGSCTNSNTSLNDGYLLSAGSIYNYNHIYIKMILYIHFFCLFISNL